MSDESFGPIVPVTGVEDLAVGVLQDYFEAYLGAVERATPGLEPGDLPMIRSWSAPQQDFREWPEEVPPALVMITPGMQAEPEVRAGGVYDAVLPVNFVVVVETSDERTADRMAKLYGFAVALCLVTQPLGRPVQKVRWRGNREDPLDAGVKRTMAGAYVAFDIYLSKVLGGGEPFDTPPADPRAPVPAPAVYEDTALRRPAGD